MKGMEKKKYVPGIRLPHFGYEMPNSNYMKEIATEEVLTLLDQLKKINEDYKRLWMEFDKAVYDYLDKQDQLKIDFKDEN